MNIFIVLGNSDPVISQKRVDYTMSLCDQDNTYIIFSGGVTTDKTHSEARLMCSYAAQTNPRFPKDHLLLEEYSMNTQQNLQYSRYVIANIFKPKDFRLAIKNVRVIVVTSQFHVLRTTAYAAIHMSDFNVSVVGTNEESTVKQMSTEHRIITRDLEVLRNTFSYIAGLRRQIDSLLPDEL
jgi:uncharacterized SAM-binding protein YcdF (DUF218 family)